MIVYTATIKKFANKGEKTGWTYIEIDAEKAVKLNPGNKKSFRVKGFLDKIEFEQTALVPMGGGNYILALNLAIRKKLIKREGDKIAVKMEVDNSEILPPPDLIECMKDEPGVSDHFYSLPKSHQNYYIKWIESAKTDATKAKRIAQTISALSRKIDFGEMLRSMKRDKMDIIK